MWSPHTNNCNSHCRAYTLDCVPFYCDVRDLQEWKCFMISKFWPEDGPRCHCCGRVKCKNRGLLHKLCVVPGITGRTMYDILTKTEPNFKVCECEDVWSTWNGPAIPFTDFKNNFANDMMKGAGGSEQNLRQRGMEGFERQSVSMLPNDPIWLQNFSDFYKHVTGYDRERVNQGLKKTVPFELNKHQSAYETRKHIYDWLQQLHKLEKEQKRKPQPHSRWRRSGSVERRRNTRSSLLHQRRRHTRMQPNVEINDPRTSEYIVEHENSPTFSQQAAEEVEIPTALLYHQSYQKKRNEAVKEKRLSSFLNLVDDTTNQYDNYGAFRTDLNLNPKRERRTTQLTPEDLEALKARFLSIKRKNNDLFVD
uniref:Uncharacterized protein n=1 Tax=Ceratitis capitata TaxID=7213 RepID=W8AX82_CERCA